MKVLRWQEASLESSKGFYRGSRLDLTVLYRCKHSCSEIHENPCKSMKIYENQWNSIIINRKQWKSSDDKKPAWNRAKISIGAAGCSLPLYTVVNIHARKSMKIHEKLQKSMKTYENHGKLLFMLGMLLITSARWVSVSLRFSGRLSTHSFAIPPPCGARLRSSNIAGQLAILGCRDWEEHPKFDK